MKLGVIGLMVGWVLALAGWWWVDQAQTRLSQAQGRLEQERSRVAVIEALGAEKLVWGERLETMQQVFPGTKEEVAEVAAKLEALAEAADIELTLQFDDFAKEVSVGSSKQWGLKIEAEVRGSYQGLTRWVDGVQQLPYLIQWAEMKVGVVEDGGGVRGEFSGQLFLLNETRT